MTKPSYEDEMWLVWSAEHQLWWRPNSQGYTDDVKEAGRYTFAKALSICDTRNSGNSYPKGTVRGVPDEVIVPAPEYFNEIRELDANRASLARVRGLLQRQWISVEERLPEENVRVFAYGLLAGACTAVYAYPSRWYGDGMPSEPAITHWQPIEPPTFPQSSSLVSQGAESADIGKLDTADEKVNECNRHDDCAAAEAAVLARHPGKTISLTFHCYDDECEDCFGQ